MFECRDLGENFFALYGDAETGGLDGAIEKWITVAEFLDENPGVYINNGGGVTCTLYQEHGGCAECPIGIYTGKDHCHGTPYYDFDGCDPAKAWAMVAFLRRLKEAQ